MPFHNWRNAFSHAFRDKCIYERKQQSADAVAIPQATDFLRPPGAPPMSTMAREIYNLRKTKDSFDAAAWSSRILQDADNSGESKDMVIGERFVEGGKKERETRFTSAEVRTQEFVDRQLNGIGTRPEKVQATFMMTAAMMCAPNIAGSDWRHIGPQICKERGWPFKKTYRMFLASAPRRFGKTRFVSMMALNYALSKPGSTTIVFSTSQGTSNLLRADMEKMLHEAVEIEFAGRRYKIAELIGSKNNQNEWRLRSPYNPDIESFIYFNPGLNPQNADKKRGQGNDEAPLLICEEMAFIDPRAFVNVIQPILNMKNALLIGISSPAYDEFNFFTRLQHIKFTNSKQHVCLTVKAELACKRCKRRNISAWCTHYNSMLPNWISSEQQYINRLIMKALNMEDAAKREIGGLTASMQNNAFPIKSIKQLHNRALYQGDVSDKPTHIGVFVDPNAGGANEMAVVSVCLTNGAFVICGMDALAAQNHEDAKHLLYNHLRLIRQDPWLQDAWLVLFVERNTGHESGHLAEVMRTFTKRAAYLEPKNESHKRKMARMGGGGQHGARDAGHNIAMEYMRKSESDPGFWTDHKMKNQFRVDLRNALIQNRIYYYMNGVSGDVIAAQNYTMEQRFAMNKEKLEEQLSRARVFLMSSAYDTGPDKYHWSGKVNAEGKKQGGYNDDLVITLSAGISLWESAMNGQLPGFPYTHVDMAEVEVQYEEV